MKKKVYKAPKVDCREIGLTPILAASNGSYGVNIEKQSSGYAKARNFGAAGFDF